MRTAVISDIHIDINHDYPVLEGLSDIIKEQGVQLLLIAGDISDNYLTTIEAVERLEELSGVKVLYVPGNHDMWDKNHEFDNNDLIYEKYLMDEHCLSGKHFETNKSFIIGDIGWYDYSYGNAGMYTDCEFDRMSINGRTFKDYNYNTWAKENKKRAWWFVDRLEAEASKNPGKQLVVMTHMLSHEAFKVPESIGNWSYLNAFLGADMLKEFCINRKAKFGICGHVHYRKNVQEGGVTWLCRCLNYESEWQGEKDVRRQILNALEVIEL